MGAFSFTKKERITKRSEFLTLSKRGIRYNTQNFLIIIIFGNNEPIRRLGITVNKKVGGAVIRNQVKRLLREFFRLHKDQLPESSDILFIAKPGSAYLTYSSLSKEMVDFFKCI